MSIFLVETLNLFFLALFFIWFVIANYLLIYDASTVTSRPLFKVKNGFFGQKNVYVIMT